MHKIYKILLLLLCVNKFLCAPSLDGYSLESEQEAVGSVENVNRVNRQIQTQQVTITQDDDSDDSISNTKDTLPRLLTLLSLLQTQPITLPGGSQVGNQMQQQGEFIIKLPFSLNPYCYAQHFLQNPELLVLFQKVIKVCGGDPNLLLLVLNQQAINQASGGGLLGGLGAILGGGGSSGGLLGGLTGLLGVGPLQQGGGLLGGLGGILGGQPGGLLGGLSGLLGVGGKGNGLLGGLGGILGGQPGGLLGGLGGLLGTSSKQNALLGGVGGILGGKGSGLLGGDNGGLVGGLLGGDNGGLVGGILGGGKGSSGGILNGVLSGNSNSGLGGILNNNKVLSGGDNIATNLVGGLTQGVVSGVASGVLDGALNGVVDGTVGGVVNNVEDSLDDLPIVGSILSRRQASDEQFNEDENEDIDSVELEIPQQSPRPEFTDKTSQQRLATNTLRSIISPRNNFENRDDTVSVQKQNLYTGSEITNQSETSNLNDNAQLLDKQKPKRKYRRRKYKIVETGNRDLVDVPETQIPTTNTVDGCEHKMKEMNNFHRSFYNTMRPPVENVPSTNSFLLNDEY